MQIIMSKLLHDTWKHGLRRSGYGVGGIYVRDSSNWEKDELMGSGRDE
jgi:hypothetical protein